MNPRIAVLVLALTSAPAYAQHEHHQPLQHQQQDPQEHAQHAEHGHQQPQEHAQHQHHQPAAQPSTPSSSPAPTYPPPSPEERVAAFPDLSGMDMRDHMVEDPVVATLLFDQFEWRDAEDADGMAGKLRGWVGTSQNKLWLRAEGTRPEGRSHGDIELLWGRPTGPWWDLLLGVRHDYGTGPTHDWLAAGVRGTAPYKIEMEATAYASAGGRFAARAEAEYDVLLTNRWILQPRLEANWRSDAARAPSGASADAEFGLRLRHEVRREFAPYVGYAWSRDIGGDTDGLDGRWVAGVRFWF